MAAIVEAQEQAPDPLEVHGAELVDRAATVVVTAVPAVGLVVALALGLAGSLRWTDVVVFAVCYVLTALGITVGFHRLLTHRAFKTSRPLLALFAILGSAAVEGPVIEWVANHRKHHAYSDRDGDPHSPHVGHGPGWGGALKGLWHAHLGWLFRPGVASPSRYAPDLLADPMLAFIDRTFLLWSVLGLAVPFGLGVALGGTITAGLTGLFWGGAIRLFVLHHVTFSINSLCHVFGRRGYRTKDESRNLAWLAPLSLGEAWHNNHHAFPTSATHGIDRGQLDLSSAVIAGLERVGLAWDVVRVTPAQRAAKLLP
jgi:stearoyl-CoA desaturase (delta-9 desaturase)